MSAPLDASSYRLLLLRLLAVPIVALSLLALTLAFGVRALERSAVQVDHSDRIVAHANLLIKLIVDQETGLRGYLLTKDPQFLQPYNEAAAPIASEFTTLEGLLRKDGLKNLRNLETAYADWAADAKESLNSPRSNADLEESMLDRKRAMDSVRAIAADLIAREDQLRHTRSAKFGRLAWLGLPVLVGLVSLAAIIVLWHTWRVFRALTTAFSGQLTHITKASEQIFEREQWLNTTLRSIGDGVIVCDSEGRITLMNEVAEDLTGWSEADAKGKRLSEVFLIVNEQTREPADNPVDKALRLGAVVGLANHTILLQKGGGEIPIDDSAAPIMDQRSQISGVVLVFRDVNDRRLSEQALIRAEKLASVARMAAAVAHEINNPLEGLINLLYLAQHERDPELARKWLAKAETELNRIAFTTRQTLGFYQDSSLMTKFDLVELIGEVAEFYRTLGANKGLKITVDAPESVEIFGYWGEMRQVLGNLLSNSVEACAAGGEIRIRVRGAGLANSFSRGLSILIADDGCGITLSNQARLFEPFFTTKQETGIGLGLWVTRQLVKKSGGSVKLRSRSEGQRTGTVARIFVPEVHPASRAGDKLRQAS